MTAQDEAVELISSLTQADREKLIHPSLGMIYNTPAGVAWQKIADTVAQDPDITKFKREG